MYVSRLEIEAVTPAQYMNWFVPEMVRRAAVSADDCEDSAIQVTTAAPAITPNATVPTAATAQTAAHQTVATAGQGATNATAPTSSQSTHTPEHNVFIIHTIYPDTGEKMLEILRSDTSAVRRHLGGYTRRDDLQVFYARKVKALFYTDASGRNTVIFTGKMESKHFHALQIMVPKYLPRLFGGNFSTGVNNPLSETELSLLKSLGNKSAVEYERLIEELAKGLDLRAEFIRIKLAGFETAFERKRADEIRYEINTFQSQYEQYLSLMRDTANKMQEQKYILAGLEGAINDHSGDSELTEYFMCNKNLTIVRVAGTSVEFVVHGYADIYDVEAFERYAGNHNGYLYTGISPAISRQQMEKLYRAIFSEGGYCEGGLLGTTKYKLRICAAYTADMRTGVKALQNYTFPLESQTYFPNPHIQSVGCIGTFAGRFQEYMQKRDYVGAIDRTAVSARNLNFYDSTVMSTFAKVFSRTNIKCVEKADGTLLTPLEAVREMEVAVAIEQAVAIAQTVVIELEATESEPIIETGDGAL